METNSDITRCCKQIADIVKELSDDIEKCDEALKLSVSSRKYAETRLTSLASRFNYSAAYKQMHDDIAAEMQVYIPSILDGRLGRKDSIAYLNTNWRNIPKSEKYEIALDITYASCEIQSFISQITVMPPEIKFIKDPKNKDGSFDRGWFLGDYHFNPGTDTIGLNLHRHGKVKTSFPVFLNTLTHENTHLLQTDFKRALYSGKMTADHPAFEDTIILKAIDDANAYIPAKIFKEAYKVQFQEAIARSFGENMETFAESHGYGPSDTNYNSLGLIAAGAALILGFAAYKHRPRGSIFQPM